MTTTYTNARILYLTTDYGQRPALVVDMKGKTVAVFNSAENGVYSENVPAATLAAGTPVPAPKGASGAYDPIVWAAATIATTRRKTSQRAFTKGAMLILAVIAGDTTITTAPDDTAAGPKGARAQSTRGNLVASLSLELGIAPKAARRTLRAAGLNAPYLDEAAVRAALTGTKAKATKTPKAAAPTPEASTPDATPAKATKKARVVKAKAQANVAADGAPLDPETTVAARRAASRRPSPAVKIEVQAQA